MSRETLTVILSNAKDLVVYRKISPLPTVGRNDICPSLFFVFLGVISYRIEDLLSLFSIMTKNSLQVLGTHIGIKLYNQEEYVSLTDIARYKNKEHPADIIKNRMRNKNTIVFL